MTVTTTDTTTTLVSNIFDCKNINTSDVFRSENYLVRFVLIFPPLYPKYSIVSVNGTCTLTFSLNTFNMIVTVLNNTSILFEETVLKYGSSDDDGTGFFDIDITIDTVS